MVPQETGIPTSTGAVCTVKTAALGLGVQSAPINYEQVHMDKTGCWGLDPLFREAAPLR